MTAQQVFNLSTAQLEEMSRAELARAVSTVASVANKRIKRLYNYGLDTSDVPALKMGSHPNRFSVAGKNKDELMNELVSINQFMEDKTSTVSGLKEVVGEIAERLGIGDKRTINLIEIKELGRTLANFKQMVEYTPDVQEKIWKYKIVKSVQENIEGANLSESEIRSRLEELYGKWYEVQQTDDLIDSDFFEVEE